MIYQAKVTRTDNNTHETYVGLTENDFKTRYRSHTASFRNIACYIYIYIYNYIAYINIYILFFSQIIVVAEAPLRIILQDIFSPQTSAPSIEV